MDHDLLVIGAGAAGLAAARTAARRGARVLLVHDGPIGGDCTFTGCVPSKTLLESAGLPFEAAMRRVREAIASIAATETTDGITTVPGRARLLGPGKVSVEERTFGAPAIVLATGSTPDVPAIDGLTGLDYLTTDTIFELDSLPASLAVIGGGATGCELAQAFAAFGSTVTIIEAAPRLLPAEDPDASAVITTAFAHRGIALLTGKPVVAARPGTLRLADGTTISADRVLVATGRRPRIPEGLDRVRVDAHLATGLDGVYAAGDVTALADLTTAADAMGRVAARNALSERNPATFDPAAIPRVIFTDPEIAQVGATTADRMVTVSMIEVDRAIAAGRTEGFVKLAAGTDGRLLGATIVAPRAGEMIAEPALAIRTGMFAGRLAQTPHGYPTWSQAIQLAATRLFGY